MKKRVNKTKIGIDKDHSVSMLRNLAVSLINDESIETTKKRTDALVPFIERLITISKKDDKNHATRLVFDRIRDKRATKKLMTVLSKRMDDRNSGYVRKIKVKNRKGDDSLIYRISFVDYVHESRREKVQRKKKEERDLKKSSSNSGILGRMRNQDNNKSQVNAKADTKAKSRSGI